MSLRVWESVIALIFFAPEYNSNMSDKNMKKNLQILYFNYTSCTSVMLVSGSVCVKVCECVCVKVHDRELARILFSGLLPSIYLY